MTTSPSNRAAAVELVTMRHVKAIEAGLEDAKSCQQPNADKVNEFGGKIRGMKAAHQIASKEREKIGLSLPGGIRIEAPPAIHDIGRARAEDCMTFRFTAYLTDAARSSSNRESVSITTCEVNIAEKSTWRGLR